MDTQIKKIELLSPVGDFECLKAAVQNGADSVYFGSTSFSARASATNFSDDTLQEAITYAKLRGVKTHLTLNTLLTNHELLPALEIAKKAYSYGIDAIIVQDLGLATLLKKELPLLPLHASTQMTIHNLDGALALQNLGFERVVLSRELSMEEIAYISEHCSIETEAFIHGALCVCYSGQCLFSSMIGGRSGNRGKCAQPCRLPYELLSHDSEGNTRKLDSGYLLSPRDLCGLSYIPRMIDANVTCLKIEGRMKSPEYVATVTRIYRKYIDMYYSSEEYSIDPEDKLELLQVFNRGGFSEGHLSSSANTNLVFKDKPNNMGIYLGNVANIYPAKKHVFLNLDNSLAIGDTIQFEKEPTKYHVSELIVNKTNHSEVSAGKLVECGRMKGNIHIGDKVYKLESQALSKQIASTYQNVENKKIPLSAHMVIKKNAPIRLCVSTLASNNDLAQKIEVSATSDIFPEEATSMPISKERIIAQLTKTKQTLFNFEKIDIILGDNLFIPSIRTINELRRNCLEQITHIMEERMRRKLPVKVPVNISTPITPMIKPKISVLLNVLHTDFDYQKLQGISQLYIPLHYFINKEYEVKLQVLCQTFSVLIYLPPIIRLNVINIYKNAIDAALQKYPIAGIIFSNHVTYDILSELRQQYPKLQFVANSTFNVYNTESILALQDMGYQTITLSPELNQDTFYSLGGTHTEMIVYGKIPIMYMNYCPLGSSNKCYPTCPAYCKNTNQKYDLQDRLGYSFRILPSSLQTITTVFHSKTLSIAPNPIFGSYRICILDESIEEIQTIIDTYSQYQSLTGNDFTSGNWNREI